MKRIIAIKECPQGQMPGTEFEAPDGAADVLVRVGAARYADDDTPVTPAPVRRRYQRRDLQAEA
jgi:hypothetical protein